MMKSHPTIMKLCLFALLLNMGAFLLLTPAKAEEEEKPKADLYVDILSQYIFRGVAFSKDSAVIQPSMTASYKGFSVNIWGNLDTDEAKGFGEDVRGTNWNETDFTASYTHELYGSLSGTAGVVYYSLVGDDSCEVFGGLSYAFPWLTVGFTAYREVGHFPGWWLQLDITRNIALPWYGMNMDLGASFGYQTIEDDDTLLRGFGKHQKFGDYSAFTAGQLSAALNIPVCKYLTISPKIGVSFPLSGDASDRIEAVSWDHEETHVFGGIRLSASF
jgi:uncharacterized protein (TIGR02001 family)